MSYGYKNHIYATGRLFAARLEITRGGHFYEQKISTHNTFTFTTISVFSSKQN